MHTHIHKCIHTHTHAGLSYTHLYFGSNLVVPIVAHALYDFIAVILLLYLPSPNVQISNATQNPVTTTYNAATAPMDTITVEATAITEEGNQEGVKEKRPDDA